MKALDYQLLSKTKINELPGSWTKEDYLALLDLCDLSPDDGSKDQEIKELCYMALSDNLPREAAKIVLNYLLKDALNEGQIDNISQEMQSEKMWEEYPEIGLHAPLFDAHQILFEAYNGKFPKPEACKIRLALTDGSHDVHEELLNKNAGVYVQILASGMDEHGLINRLFTDELVSGKLDGAHDIIWKSTIEKTDSGFNLEIISSTYWLDDFVKEEGSCAIIINKDVQDEDE